MGLFSKLFKNKQDTAGEDSGYYSRADDQAATERARSKRASSADGAARPRARAAKEEIDPVLPEKKRARRRLVGAIALALAVAVGLPMLLDSEPKPLASDIDIKIPSKDKPAEAPAHVPTMVAASAALDNTEEIVSEARKPAAVAAVKPAPVVSAAPAVAEPTVDGAKSPARDALKDGVKADVKQVKQEADAKARAELEAKVKAEAKAEAKAKADARMELEHKLAEVKAAEAKAVKPAVKEEGKTPDDAARALAILEGKVAKPAEPGQKFVLQVAALATQDKVDELQEKLREAGIKSYTQKVPTQAGERTRIRVGPFTSKEEAEKVRARLTRLGLNGSLVPG